MKTYKGWVLVLGLAWFMGAASAAGADAHPHAHGGIEVEVVAKSTRMWDGEALPSYPAGQPEVSILKITIPPKSKLPWHKHPVINAGVLLSGELVVRTEAGDTLQLKAGDSLVELVDRWHFGENPGEAPAVILVFYAGIQGKPITVIKDADEAKF